MPVCDHDECERTKCSREIPRGSDQTLGEKLLPCPFCNSDAEWGETDDGGIYICCSNAMCAASSQLKFPMGKDNAREELIELWNTRNAVELKPAPSIQNVDTQPSKSK
jgi:hypothetical protein